MPSNKLFAALAAAGILVIPVPANAHCRATTVNEGPTDQDGCPATGKPLFWKKACVGWAVSEKASNQIGFAMARALLGQAFSTWSSASCGGAPPFIQFIDQSPTSVTDVEYITGGPNVNLVVFRDEVWPHPGSQEVALTTVTFNGSTGEIYDADMEFDTSEYDLSVGDTNVAYDFSSIATHQVGHLLGFAHSPDLDSTMFPAYESGTTDMRDLSPDDVEGLCEAYRPDGTRPTADGVVQATACDVGSAVPCPSSTVAGCTVSSAPNEQADLRGWVVLLAGLVASRLRRVRRFEG